jgi:hypothetical protein
MEGIEDRGTGLSAMKENEGIRTMSEGRGDEEFHSLDSPLILVGLQHGYGQGIVIRDS